MFDPPELIPSIISGFEKTEAERKKFRQRKKLTTLFSFLTHALIIFFVAPLLFNKKEGSDGGVIIVVSNLSMYLPPGAGEKGGGGGGKKEKLPAEKGRLPETVKPKLVVSDPEEPQPLIPPEEKDDSKQKLLVPLEIPQDLNLPVGNVQAPPNQQGSSGSGSGGGQGTGQGTGSGSGSGAGGGSGSGGGIGSGSGGGIGDGTGPYSAGGGVILPVPILQPNPFYTEEARKQRVEGALVLEVIIEKNGRIESVKVIKGLGYGLDESAIETVTKKWLFKPGTLKGEKVRVQARIEIVFKLL